MAKILKTLQKSGSGNPAGGGFTSTPRGGALRLWRRGVPRDGVRGKAPPTARRVRAGAARRVEVDSYN